MLSHTRMGVPYEYTHMGRPIRVWANIRIWGRTIISDNLLKEWRLFVDEIFNVRLFRLYP